MPSKKQGTTPLLINESTLSKISACSSQNVMCTASYRRFMMTFAGILLGMDNVVMLRYPDDDTLFTVIKYFPSFVEFHIVLKSDSQCRMLAEGVTALNFNSPALRQSMPGSLWFFMDLTVMMSSSSFDGPFQWLGPVQLLYLRLLFFEMLNLLWLSILLDGEKVPLLVSCGGNLVTTLFPTDQSCRCFSAFLFTLLPQLTFPALQYKLSCQLQSFSSSVLLLKPGWPAVIDRLLQLAPFLNDLPQDWCFPFFPLPWLLHPQTLLTCFINSLNLVWLLNRATSRTAKMDRQIMSASPEKYITSMDFPLMITSFGNRRYFYRNEEQETGNEEGGAG